MEDAGEGIYRQLVHQLCCRRRSDLHSHRDPVPLPAEILCGRRIRRGERLTDGEGPRRETQQEILRGLDER